MSQFSALFVLFVLFVLPVSLRAQGFSVPDDQITPPPATPTPLPPTPTPTEIPIPPDKLDLVVPWREAATLGSEEAKCNVLPLSEQVTAGIDCNVVGKGGLETGQDAYGKLGKAGEFWQKVLVPKNILDENAQASSGTPDQAGLAKGGPVGDFLGTIRNFFAKFLAFFTSEKTGFFHSVRPENTPLPSQPRGGAIDTSGEEKNVASFKDSSKFFLDSLCPNGERCF